MRRLICLFITLGFISCSTDKDQYQLAGDARGYSDGTKVYVYSVYGDNRPLIMDTLSIVSGKFGSQYAFSDLPSLNYLTVENTQANVIFFPEWKEVQVNIYKDSLDASYATGGTQNDDYYTFSRQIDTYNEQKQEQVQKYQQARREQDNLLASQIQQQNLALVGEETQYKKKYIKDHSESLFSLMLLSEMLNRKQITAAETKQLYAGFGPNLTDTQIAKNLEDTMTNLAKAEVGSVAPDFSGPTPDGKTLSLKDAMGKYTIIDFWASWCKPCRRENPNVVRAYNKYHDKGLNIISVSLDRNGQRDRWIHAIEDDKMDWYHISHLKFWQDPIARQYNVKAIPATFLLDEDGNIIDKNLRGQALHDKLATLMKTP
ncbi:TlpA disulfide reductase family protein [Aureitalea marina]|uniref:Thioredoxin domain-containing protein n=1 Tax=Aureitalea marina TaxID=930804 RepID=A0A2S7KNL7_9FLAO|nr:TlpA disulfide reductase family protein [Aureitalea marina]PQB04219.1 hypothetical protein BST85_04355 [Aureitalea marina]